MRFSVASSARSSHHSVWGSMRGSGTVLRPSLIAALTEADEPEEEEAAEEEDDEDRDEEPTPKPQQTPRPSSKVPGELPKPWETQRPRRGEVYSINRWVKGFKRYEKLPDFDPSFSYASPPHRQSPGKRAASHLSAARATAARTSPEGEQADEESSEAESEVEDLGLGLGNHLHALSLGQIWQGCV